MTADALTRYGQLDPATAGTVAAAFGRDPMVGPYLDDADLTRLGSIVDAVAAGITPQPMTPDEAEAPVLDMDGPAPITSATIRARIRLLDDHTRQVFLARWSGSGLPQVLADADGADVILDRDAYLGLERLLAEHEPPAGDEHRALFEWVATLSREAKVLIEDRLKHHGLGSDQLSPSSLNVTTGRHHVLTVIVDSVLEQVDAGAVPFDDGLPANPEFDVDPEPHVEADVPPEKGTISDLLDWVGTDPTRAAALLEREQSQPKPRKSLVASLTGFLNGPAPAAVTDTDPGQPIPSAPGVVVSVPPPAAGADGRYTSKPVAEWGQLDRAAFFSRLSADLEKAARILGELAHEANHQ